MIRYALNEDLPREKVLDVFKHGKDFPRRYYQIYNELANFLLPKWHGAPGELESTAAALKKLLGGELGDEVYFRMACTGFLDFGEKFFDQSNFIYADLKPGLLVTIRDNCESDPFVNYGCLMACLAGDKETASLLCRRLDKATLNTAIWGNLARIDFWRHKYDPYIEPAEEVKTIYDPFRTPVFAVAFAGNNHLLSTSRAPLMLNWDLSAGKLVGIIKAGSHGVRNLLRSRPTVQCWPLAHLTAISRFGRSRSLSRWPMLNRKRGTTSLPSVSLGITHRVCYNFHMSPSTISLETEILARVIRPDDPRFSPEAAQSILALGFDVADTERINSLATKARQGSLDEQEEMLLQAYMFVGAVVDLMHSKARLALEQTSA